MSDASKRKAKQSKNGSSRNQSSIMPDNYAVSSSLNQIINPTWKILMKDVDLVKPTTFLDHVYLGCTQRECQISKGIVDNYRNMFKSRISAGAIEKIPKTKATEKPDAETISSCSCDVEGHAKKFVEWSGELANKTNEQLYTVATLCIDDHQFK